MYCCPVGASVDVSAGRSLFLEEVVRKLKIWAGVLVGVGVLMAGAVEALDLPCVIGEFRYDYPASGYTAIGDQNGDGKDELLVSLSTLSNLNHFEIHYGSNDMGRQPDIVIPAFRENEEVGGVWYLGHLIPGYTKCFVTKSTLRNPNENVILNDFHLGVETGRDSLFDTWTTTLRRNARLWGGSAYLRPFDFNGDGYDDICLSREISATEGAMDVYYGGAAFDSIPDWTKNFTFAVRQDIWAFNSSSGYDINGDGFQDMLIKGTSVKDTIRQVQFFELYLGGAEPDTNPVFRIWDESLQRRPNGQFLRMNYGFSMLPDVNDDGYADFGIYFDEWVADGVSFDGIFLFFGGEHPDSEPDMTLEGNHGADVPGEGWLTGGDFDGDGDGDIAVSYWQRPPITNGEVNYHFGGPNLDTIPDVIATQRDYGGRYPNLGQAVGAVGDYNGDGADDVVVQANGAEIQFVILAGSRDWVVSVGKDYPISIPANFTVTTYPNPFNNRSIVSFQLPERGELNVVLYDLAGRRVQTFERHIAAPGSQSLLISGEGFSSGIYYLVADLTAVTERFQTKAKIVHIQ